ncbi:uncharacterized protein si:ch1073-406l10.2 isoform X2 [Erpetoichthys calabaricus]|uniref:uncharacterized protein si:ch1073-406l10.2 isoform X2 n=1 Tax=Erpetoichthys calabaricus TaxID=27687 RepID=UPI0010A01ED1|nr:uncharacterized protein si:ch1073-406l10.2 isoform X2 [Erpetoichthys calabaricus]
MFHKSTKAYRHTDLDDGTVQETTTTKMSVQLLLLLLCAGVLEVLTNNNEYSNLPQLYQNAVDLTMKQFTERIKATTEYGFYSLTGQKEDESIKYHKLNFFLRQVICEGNNVCRFNSNRPLIDCVMCFISNGDNVKDGASFSHCIIRPAFLQKQNKIRSERGKGCSGVITEHGHRTGGETLLALKKL